MTSNTDKQKRPLVWVFPGIGSQWPQMGKDLLNIPIFKQTIERCNKILSSKGLDLFHIITTDDRNIFENILHAYVGINSIELALVNLLKELEVEPDYILGHSFGEVACGYVDGCLTEEESLMSSYYRGKVSLRGSKVPGKMAFVALNYDSIKSLLPEDIDVACHNSPKSCSISGPKESVEKFVEEIKLKGIKAAIIPTAGMAYHSRYIYHLGDEYLEYMRNVIPNPKKRSSKWISSSVLYKNWEKHEATVCSGEYFTNNLRESVFFEEGMTHIPSNAICLEVAPQGLLQQALASGLPGGTQLSLTDKDDLEGVKFLIKSLKE